MAQILLLGFNGNWINTKNGATIRSASSADLVIVNLNEMVSVSNNSFSIPIEYKSDDVLSGLDFSIDYNGDQLAVNDLSAEQLNGDWNVVYNILKDEKVMVNSYSTVGVESSAAVLWMNVTTDGHIPTVADLGTVEAYLNGNPATVRIENGTSTTGLVSAENTALMVAYPNPFNQSIQVKLADTNNGIFNVSVYDVSGRVCETKVGVSAGEVIEMGTLLGAGMYLIEVQGADRTERIQVVKQ